MEDFLQTAAEMRAALASGQLTATDALSECLARIAERDPVIRAVITLCPGIEQQAAAADERLRAGAARPLEGVPVLIKDNIAVTGTPTTAGSFALAESAPPDAPLVTRLREAGAVIVGKTNLSEWANFRSTRATSGWSAVGGQTRNPHALDRSASGSSSGSGAAVAAGYVPIAIGTETDGSIVSPAGCCGIVGLKPTLGAVPGSGIIPISSKQDVAGPMTRCVADAALVYAVLAGLPPAQLAPGALRGARIGLWVPVGADEPTTLVLKDAAAAAQEAGATVVPVEIDPAGIEPDEWPALLSEFHAEIDAYLATAPNAAARSLAELVEFNGRHDVELSVFGQELFEQALAAEPVTSTAYRAHRDQARAAARRELDNAFAAASVDAILTVTNEPAWPIDYAQGDRIEVSTTSPAAVAGYPTITVPAGSVGALPVGVSLIGRAGSDAAMLALALDLEACAGRLLAPSS